MNENAVFKPRVLAPSQLDRIGFEFSVQRPLNASLSSSVIIYIILNLLEGSLPFLSPSRTFHHSPPNLEPHSSFVFLDS